ncbi:MAG TPA: cobalamin biosynthesis protein CbiA [candidate division Zixibacteria bacterium]|nr:cobalamin biosynthesis protein CbiA [candidate division Zixibacteria bacterium]
MARPTPTYPSPSFAKRVLTIVGGYGSGKSEVAVNLARQLALTGGKPVAIADLDIVNPYFRSREATRQLSELGIQSIHPTGGLAHADLPIILPEVRGAMEQFGGTLILDVGGDDVGARVLGSLADAVPADDYELLLVLNAHRPFTATVAGCRALMAKIEATSRLAFTGIISNTHMLEHTTVETIREGLRLARALAADTSLPIAFVAALEDQVRQINPEEIDVPVLMLDRLLLKPWERPSRRPGG